MRLNLQTQNGQFWLRFNEKMSEQAEHTGVFEHCEGIFSLNIGHKSAGLLIWTASAGSQTRAPWMARVISGHSHLQGK